MKNKLAVFAFFALVASGPLYAHKHEVDVKNAWVRTAVPGQNATGAFMTITHKNGARLVRGTSAAAGVTEIHEMKMEGDVMKMRAVPEGVDLPAGKAVELAPGGYHLMLMDLKAALPKDATVPISLWFRDAKGVETKVDLNLPVAASSPGAKAGAPGAADAVHKH